jgi:hypothetical protein
MRELRLAHLTFDAHNPLSASDDDVFFLFGGPCFLGRSAGIILQDHERGTGKSVKHMFLNYHTVPVPEYTHNHTLIHAHPSTHTRTHT